MEDYKVFSCAENERSVAQGACALYPQIVSMCKATGHNIETGQMIDEAIRISLDIHKRVMTLSNIVNE